MHPVTPTPNSLTCYGCGAATVCRRNPRPRGASTRPSLYSLVGGDSSISVAFAPTRRPSVVGTAIPSSLLPLLRHSDPPSLCLRLRGASTQPSLHSLFLDSPTVLPFEFPLVHLTNVPLGQPSFGAHALPNLNFEGKPCPVIASRGSYYAWLVKPLVSEGGFN